tara:strand:- start:910 stop:1083 length:174 start_codon:yes stop_codon:yes gene_type:complete
MNALKEWVDHHLPVKTNEELWYLSAEILTELSQRDNVDYRVKATEESLKNKMEALNG